MSHPRVAPGLWAVVFVLVAVPLAAQRTPEQRYFAWTDLPFPAVEYTARRMALATALRQSGGGIFLAPAAAGASEGFTFRQVDTFWYLTGLEVPDALVAIDSDDGRTTVYAPPRDARFENPSRRNDFPGRPLQADPDLAVRTGLAAVRPIAQFETDLAAWVAAGRTLRVGPGRTQDGGRERAWSDPARGAAPPLRGMARTPASDGAAVERLSRRGPHADGEVSCGDRTDATFGPPRRRRHRARGAVPEGRHRRARPTTIAAIGG